MLGVNTCQNSNFDQQNWNVHGDVQNVGQITYNYTTELPPGELPQPAEILPYLANRDLQADSLEQYTAGLLEKNNRKAIVCVIPGPVNEIPVGFIRRCDQVLLQELLLLYNQDTSFLNINLQWPPHELNVADRLSRLRSELCKKLKLRLGATEHEIVAKINAKMKPISFRSIIDPKKWNEAEQTLIQQWIDFLLNLPELAPERTVFMFLGLHYDIASSTSHNNNKNDRRNAPIIQESSKTKQMKTFVKTLKNEPRENLICLSELKPLSSNDLSKWASSVCPDAVKNAQEGLLDEGLLQAHAIKLCPENANKPLGDLLDGMRKALLAACHHRLVTINK